MSQYERDRGKQLDFRGMNTVLPPDRMPANKFPYACNVRRYKPSGIVGRALQGAAVETLPAAVHSLRRLNDTTPDGPVGGYALVAGAADKLYVGTTQVDSGYSGNPLSLVAFRPNASPQPWIYVGDSNKMSKVRSDGTRYKAGIKEPQVAPIVSFVPASDVLSLLGDVTVYYFNNPTQAHNAPLTNVYLWHNPSDKGPSNLVETASMANGVNTGNSLLFDDGLSVGGSNPVAWSQYQTYVGTVSVSGTAVTWDSGDQFNGLAAGDKVVISGVTYTIAASPSPTNTSFSLTASAGSQTAANYTAAKVSGTVALFAPAMESEGYQDFNCSILGTFYVPVAGTYTFTVYCKDDFLWGIGNSPNGTASWPGKGTLTNCAGYGQTKTVLNAYPLMPRTQETSGEGGHNSSATLAVTFSAAGNYPFEIDWDYWYHTGRGLQVKVNGANIPPIPPSAITNSQYRYRYRSSETGAKSNGSPASPQSPLSVLSNNITATPSDDPQADKIDFFRLDQGLTDYTYVGTIDNGASVNTTLTSGIPSPGAILVAHLASVQGLVVGQVLSVDTSTSQENVTVLSIGSAYPEAAISSWTYTYPGGSRFPQLTFNVATTVGFVVGDSIQAKGTDGTLYGPWVIASIGSGTIVVNALALPSGDPTGGLLLDISKPDPFITAYFVKTHSIGAVVTALSGTFNDTLLDVDVAGNPILELDNYEPFPSIDLPRKGTVNVANGGVIWQSGDTFNVRWLPGTIIIVGTTAYTLDKRPTSTTTLTCTNVDIVNGIETVVVPPDATGVNYEISEPILAAQPLPYTWGPTDNAAFEFGCGDPLRPGTLYWTKGNDFDSAPDTNQADITSPTDALINGVWVTGFGIVFSADHRWTIWPNYFNALATVEGTSGATWTFQGPEGTRGLYIPRALATDGTRVFFRAKDGIYLTAGGGEDKSITDEDLYNLFPHEGMVPQTVSIAGNTIYPPDDTQPNSQRFACATGFLYYNYLGTDGNPHTLVYDILAGAWVWDVYQYPATVHALEEGAGVNGVLTGCLDGSVRVLSNSGTETVTATVLMPCDDAGDSRAQKHWGDVYLEVKH